MRKLSKIIVMTAVLMAVLVIPCFAEEADMETARGGLSGAVSGVLQWITDNPAAVFSTIISGVTGGFCLGGGVSNRKTRKEIKGDSTGLAKAAATINNNAAELAGKVKTEVGNMITSVDKAVGKILTTLCEKADEITAAIKESAEETRAMRREVKANSFLVRELFKDSRLTELRKEEIEAGYNDIMRGGEPSNDEHDQA